MGIAIAWIVHLLMSAHSATAQAPAQGEPPTPQFLEDRVRDELISEGADLAGRNLRLHVEQLASAWLVSLVEISTGAAVASTRIDRLPADRDAAVAVMTNVVADLAAGIDDRAERPKLSPPVAAEPPRVEPPPAAHELPSPERRQAELRYRQQSLRFTALYEVSVDDHGLASVHRQWLVLRGHPGEVVSTREFYRALGRDDLVRAHGRRHAMMIGSYTVGSVALVATAVIAILILGEKTCRSDGTPQFGNATCYDLSSDPLVPWLITLGVGIAGMAAGTHYLRHPEPIDDAEARALADDYNQRLRGRLGLVRATPRPVLRDVTFTPYVLGREGGLALRARF